MTFSEWIPARDDGKPCEACKFDVHYLGRCSLPWNRPGYFEEIEMMHISREFLRLRNPEMF